MKLGSLFDGIGGFPYSAQKYGITPVWASEIEPWPIKVTEKHFPNMKHLGDITKISGAEIEPVDIITFGSPCQGLSLAGKREGLQDERSGLFTEAVRIIREMRAATGNKYPRFAVWENVPGAFSSNKRQDFRAVLEEIAETEIPMPVSGKWANAGLVRTATTDIAWRVLDAQYWGVPQRRRRIFLVADFGGQCAGEILFVEEGLRGHFAESEETREGTSDNVDRSIRKASHVVKIPVYDIGDRRSVANESIDNPPTLTARMGTGGNNVPVFIEPQSYCLQDSMIGRADKNGPQGDGINEEVSFTLNTTDRHAVAYGIDQQGGQRQPCVIAFAANQRDEVRDLNDKAGALQAEPGMKQQTFIYGICSDSSNSMKSSNPHSGIYKADTTRTLDLNGGNPTCNQGGMAIVQTYSFQRSDEFKETDKASTQSRRQYKDATDLVVGALCARDFKGVGNQYVDEGKCVIENNHAVRRLTPLECTRLQGFPDYWLDIEGMSDTQKYKAIGNSVAIPCVDYVMQGVALILEGSEQFAFSNRNRP